MFSVCQHAKHATKERMIYTANDPDVAQERRMACLGCTMTWEIYSEFSLGETLIE
jgi:hypothetical protein